MLSRMRPSVVLALAQVVGEGSAFLRNLILARLIGAEQMGLAVALALGIRVIEMFSDFGLKRLLVQVRSSELDRVRGAVHLIRAAKACILVVCAMLLAVPLTGAINSALSPAMFMLAATAIIIRGLANCDYRERQRQRDFTGVLLVEGGSNMAALMVIAPIAIATRDYSALVWASLVQATVLCGLSHLIAKRPMSWLLDIATIKKALRFGVPIACNGALIFLAMQGDRLIVAVHFTPEELAKFAIAAQISLFPTLAGARFLLAFDLPRFARLVDEPSELRVQFKNRLIFVSGVALLLALGLGLLGNTAIGLLFGAGFVSAPTIMALLAVVAGIRLIRAVPNTLLMATGRTSIMLACNVPRILALFVALAFIAYGAGLVQVVAIGMVSEAISLLLGLTVVAGFGRHQIGLAHSSVETSS